MSCEKPAEKKNFKRAWSLPQCRPDKPVWARVLDTRLALRAYTLQTGKVQKPIRVVFCSDLHNVAYGPAQEELVQAIRRQKPDLILMGGDMADTRRRHGRALWLVRRLSARYPCYYVSGNHEVDSGLLPRIKNMMRAMGAQVLQGECRLLSIQGQALYLCGVDDPTVNRLGHLKQVEQAKPPHKGPLSILLSHRPEMAPFYRHNGYDVIFAGHAHGGQWRLPGLCNGFFAPDQGFFAPYVGGLYALGDSLLVVGRGLARDHVAVPRIFNPPELVVLDIQPLE